MALFGSRFDGLLHAFIALLAPSATPIPRARAPTFIGTTHRGTLRRTRSCSLPLSRGAATRTVNNKFGPGERRQV
jgi:hypothetical protein